MNINSNFHSQESIQIHWKDWIKSKVQIVVQLLVWMKPKFNKLQTASGEE